ncbi:AvrE-family type 3 secretion system effector, partial [Mesorhizobium japonicum]|uniref:AvrE-family type 3 secretion system effector n=1 Tax=Mesorhizobium japonicum TaxID=2066070 RepID=UPI003B5C138D
RALALKVRELTQQLNIDSSGHDLIKALKAPFAHLGGTSDTPKLLESLEASGLRISHQKTSVPRERHRDLSDSQGLAKARLALDAITVDKLATLLETFEGTDEQVRRTAFEQIQKEYEGDLIRQVTDMGFTDHVGLEAVYDGIKSVLKGLKKEDHTLSINLRCATGSRSR